MIGDVIGSGGRAALAKLLPDIRRTHQIDFVCVQGENSAAGFGINAKVAKELLACGADVITTGNHIWDRKEIIPVLEEDKLPIIRPANYFDTSPGKGVISTAKATVVNLIGQRDMGVIVNSPFLTATELLEELPSRAPILVDFHAEATSEKYAIGRLLDGKVSAVVGTHTHVPTADEQILSNGTAYVSDLGFVGAVDSILGMDPHNVLLRFTTGLPHRLTPVVSGLFQFNSVMIDINDQTGKATAIRRVDHRCEV